MFVIMWMKNRYSTIFIKFIFGFYRNDRKSTSVILPFVRGVRCSLFTFNLLQVSESSSTTTLVTSRSSPELVVSNVYVRKNSFDEEDLKDVEKTNAVRVTVQWPETVRNHILILHTTFPPTVGV